MNPATLISTLLGSAEAFHKKPDLHFATLFVVAILGVFFYAVESSTPMGEQIPSVAIFSIALLGCVTIFSRSYKRGSALKEALRGYDPNVSPAAVPPPVPDTNGENEGGE